MHERDKIILGKIAKQESCDISLTDEKPTPSAIYVVDRESATGYPLYVYLRLKKIELPALRLIFLGQKFAPDIKFETRKLYPPFDSWKEVAQSNRELEAYDRPAWVFLAFLLQQRIRLSAQTYSSDELPEYVGTAGIDGTFTWQNRTEMILTQIEMQRWE